MATAYTIRYGNPNAGGGPDAGGAGVDGLRSTSTGFLGETMVAALGDGDGALVSGGGSMAKFEVSGLECIAGSGNGAISSSVPVSIVISLVSELEARML